MALVAPVPHLLDEVSHVHFLVLHVQHPRMFQHPPWSCSSRWFFLETAQTSAWFHRRSSVVYVPAFDEVFEIVRPANAILGFIFKFWNRLTDNVGKKVNQSCARLHFCSVGREWESMLSNFE